MAPNEEIYEFAIIMVDLLDALLLPTYNAESLENLRHLVSRHNTKRIELFGSLTPKMHFLTHYPRLIRLCGPLKFVWCFAMERKHQDVKQYLKVNKNRKNVAISIGKKIAMQESLMIVRATDIFKKVGKTGKTMLNQNYNFLLENQENFDCVPLQYTKALNTELEILS